MTSPFPGMDPYLEDPEWMQDFHHSFAVALRFVLNPRLPRRYYVKVEHRVVVDEVPGDSSGSIGPDVSILTRRKRPGRERPSGGVAISEPVIVRLPRRIPGKQFFLEIFDSASRRLVTAIEILSPANKRPQSEDRRAYLAKRDAYLEREVHFIEIDLLRTGERWPASGEPPATYRVLLSHARERPRAQVWPIRLKVPLPTIPVPLASDDPDVALPLQDVLDHAYDSADYDRMIDRAGPVAPPPLSRSDAAWVASRLKKGRPR